MNVTEVEKNFINLVNQVHDQGISIDVESDDKINARLIPAEPPSPLSVSELNTFLRQLPVLDDDVAVFAKDIRDIRKEFPS